MAAGGRPPPALRLPAGEAAWLRRHGRASLHLRVTTLAADGALGTASCAFRPTEAH